MHVPIYPRFLAALLLFASFAGSAQAVEFDEKLKAPMVKEPATLRAQAQSYITRFASLKEVAQEELIRNRTLEAERVDLTWQIQTAIDAHEPLGDLSAIGLMRQDDGSYRVDYNVSPHWTAPGEFPSYWLKEVYWGGFGPDLISRGFLPDDVTRLQRYVESHDPQKVEKQRSLPLAVSFSKVVKKYDRIKKPVSDALVFSYLYQLRKVRSEALREWADGLLGTVDAQRGRILLAFFAEMPSTGVWSPSDQRTGIDTLLIQMRLPDFEQLATAEMTGGQS